MSKTTLYTVLVETYALGDLEVLCFEVEEDLRRDGLEAQVSLDVVGGDSIRVIALRLINYLDKRGYLRYLVNRVLHGRRDKLTAGQRRDLESLNAAPARATASPRDPLTDYRLSRIEALRKRWQLDTRFVHLTLLHDQGPDAQGARFVEMPEARQYHDLRELLAGEPDAPAFVVLGAPGSGKSTLLRRLQFDHCHDRLADGGGDVAFFVSLYDYRDEKRPDGQLVTPEPRAWLAAEWARLDSHLPRFDDLLRDGRLLLLLDALNEMPHRDADDYRARVNRWREFLHRDLSEGNRAVFTCRSLDYTALSVGDVVVQQVTVKPMTPEQIRAFLRAYKPEQAEAIWAQLEGSPEQLALFSTPYFLKLLVDQIGQDAVVPNGRAALFTGFVRQTLLREIQKDYRLLAPGALLDDADHRLLSTRAWDTPYRLPESGCLIPKLSELADKMQRGELRNERRQVSVPEPVAREMIAHACAGDILAAGMELNILDRDLARGQVRFFHQLLQEYFAARLLSRQPDPSLVQGEWRADRAQPSLADVLKSIPDYEPLPGLPTTGWEETTVIAAAMSADPEAFVRDLMPANLPLAARCAAAPDVRISDGLKRDLQQALIARTQDPAADLRARIAAGLALGNLGDPRFERRRGPHGVYLAPPLVTIPAGDYPIGDDASGYAHEQPAHTVRLAAFQIGMFSVTNAEYRCFVDANGYDDERWWDTEAARAWREGKGAAEGRKQAIRDQRAFLQENLTDDEIRSRVPERFTSRESDLYIWLRNVSDEEFEAFLDEVIPTGKIYRQPEYWDDPNFNNPAQPVVGITWHEARAYCNWLAAQTGRPFRLPSEVELEAAARGLEGRAYAFGPQFDASKCNTFESHIRRTTPVGIFPPTPSLPGESWGGVHDLCGNVWEWTLSLWGRDFDEPEFRYPYTDRLAEREDVHAPSDVYRVLRGGAWDVNRVSARAAYRDWDHSVNRDFDVGFRVAVPVPQL